MKHLKLFFALFAMLALGVGNAWGAEKITDYSKIVTGKTYYIGATTGGTDYYLSVSGASTSTSIAGTAKTDKANATAFVFTGSGTSWTIKFADYANYLGLKSSKDNGKLQVVASAATFTASNQSGKLRLSIGSYSIQKNNSGTQFGSYGNTQTDIWLEEIPSSSEPTTQYTIKWHTAKGVTTDVTLNEGATITEPATEPTMTGYTFMGWTASCDVASDGADFTALTDFGTADSDKDFYAVFAVATTTGGGEATTGNVTMKYSGTTTANMTEGNNAATVGLDANEWSVVPTKGSASNMPGLNKDGDIRLYGHASGGNYLTITSKSYTITSAEITYTSNSYNNGKFYVNGVETAAGNINSKEFVIKNANSGTTQVRIKTLVINYTSGSAGTTTYSNYITTCASGIEYVELGDDFKWSAAEAEVTIDATDNEFPTLKNTHSVPVKYSSSDDAIASIASDGTVTLNNEGTVTITAKYEGGTSAGTGKEYKATSVDYTLTVKPAPLEPIAGGVIDILDNDWSGLTTSDYATVAAKTAANTGHSNAQYTAQCAGSNSSIQLRSNNSNSGIVSTVSGGLVKRVEIEWNDATSTDRTLNIYGSNTPYTNPTDLYDTNKDGDKLGTIVKGTSTYLEISEDYRYIGLRSASGAMYLAKVTITWLPINSKVTVDSEIANGSISVSGAADLNAVAAGTELTLSNTPATGYKLTAYDVYKTDDATTKVTVADGKFTMPEYDVTISATFEAAKTLTSIEITTAATQTTFWQGETFNYTGLEVTAHFDGADDKVVTPTVTGSTATAGTQTVTVSFTEGSVTKTTTYEITVKATANTEATAYDVTTAREIIDKVSTANDIYVQGIVSEIVTAYNATYGNITYNISADGLTTSAQLQAFRGKSFNGDNFTSADDVKVGDEVVVFGNLLLYNSTYELAADNKLISLNRNKAAAGLAFETTEYTANVNEAFTAPTLTNPNGLTVTYSTSDATLATVNATTGAVTILNKTGKVTITATFAGNSTYLFGTASYNITISDPSLLEATFVAATDLGNTTRGEGSIAKSPITFACSDGILGNGSEYRLYQDANITFAAENGYAITKVVITSTASGTSQYGPGLLSNENGTYSVSDKTGTWVGEAQTVTFTATAQSRAKLITVYYKTDNRQDAGLAWITENVSITIGDAFTVPTLSNPNGLTLTCTSDNENLATVTNAGVVTLKSGVTGKATITAKFDGNSNYKDATVTCTITVNPKTETVVILAQYNGQWYALKNVEETAGKVLAALPVNYVGGKLYNVEEADKATIEWQRAAVTDGIIFKNGEDYIYGTAGSTDLKLSTTECAWTLDGTTYKLGNRTFFYNETANGFKNYNTSNAGNSGFSSLPVVTAPVYATGQAYGRSVNLGTDGYRYGTICLPFGSKNYTGATFYECVGKETGKVILGSVTALVAGTPYIFLASATEVAVYGDGTTAATAGNSNGLYGTFTDGTVVAANDDNHILLNNELRKVAETCWVNANRAYLVMSEVPTEYTKMPGRRYIGMSVQGENEATGFENITAPEGQVIKAIVNGQLVIIRGGEMYNVQGQKL